VSAMQEAERRSPQVARELDFAASPYAGSPSQL
jgi:hypothetical protein